VVDDGSQPYYYCIAVGCSNPSLFLLPSPSCYGEIVVAVVAAALAQQSVAVESGDYYSLPQTLQSLAYRRMDSCLTDVVPFHCPNCDRNSSRSPDGHP
jgi:hypothetical protein